MVERTDHYVPGDQPGLLLFVREAVSARAEGVPVIALHGARVPAVASFDLSVPGYSLIESLAIAGHRTFAFEPRGYGRSTRPAAMEDGASLDPVVRSNEVVRDIGSVVDFVLEHTGFNSVALLGWATGWHWCGYFSSLYPDAVSHLIVYNSLYGRCDAHPFLGHGSPAEDPERPGRFNSSVFGGAYRLNTAASLLESWDNSIPQDDKSAWRDPAVTEAYLNAAIASDDTAATREPPSFRSPNGAMEDSFYLAIGHQMWDASLITGKVLIIRGALDDFWSRPQDAENLAADLIHAASVEVVKLNQATHYVHLDRPEHGRDQFLCEVIRFLST